jgi:hypothetical protein
MAVVHASVAIAAGAPATAASAELRNRGRVRKQLAPNNDWQTTPTAVARRVVEDEQQDAAAMMHANC